MLKSFGLVLLEAMACGVPCIGTNIGGIPEVIKNNVSGFLVDVSDVAAATDRAMSILEDEQLSKRFTEAAMEILKNEFSSQKIVSQYEQIYADLAEPE